MSAIANRCVARPWSGHFLWQPGLLSYVGLGGSSDRHSHHALQLAISFDEPLELSLDDRQVRGRAVLVGSGVPHAFRTDGRRIFYALVEPHSAIGFSLTQRTTQVTGRDLADILPFSEQVGIPFRRFVLWLRLRRAAEHAWRTQSLTEAAHAAGFSDLAHFSRVCRATFGVAPTGLQAMGRISASWPTHAPPHRTR